MGISSDGLLWYGYNLEHEDDEGLPESVANALRAVDPEFEDDPEGTAEKLLEPFGCWLVGHCSYDYTMYGLCITHNRASRGGPRTVSMDMAPEWDDKLRAAAAAIGYDVGDAKPQWWLASMYG